MCEAKKASYEIWTFIVTLFFIAYDQALWLFVSFALLHLFWSKCTTMKVDFFFVICGDLMFYNLSSQVLIFELCACFFFFFCTLFFFLWGKFVNYKGKGRTFCICSDLLCCFSSSEEPLIISLLLAPHCLYFQMHLWNYGNERNLLASSIFGDY
jgi:hypothetical protein